MPAWTVTVSFALSMAMTLFMRKKSTTTPPFTGRTPPYPDEALPRGVSGILFSLAHLTSSTSSSSVSGWTTASGTVDPMTGFIIAGIAAMSCP